MRIGREQFNLDLSTFSEQDPKLRFGSTALSGQIIMGGSTSVQAALAGDLCSQEGILLAALVL
jgi:hypothetical protein